MKILVGVPCYDMVEAVFADSMDAAVKCNHQVEVFRMRKSNTPSARNKMVDYALEHDFSHILWLDTDMVHPAGTLMRLLSHGVNIVGGLYCMARDRFVPCAFKLTPDFKYGVVWYRIGDGIQEVDAIGTGCLLVDTNVFKVIPPPWFNYSPVGGGSSGLYTEDFYFCELARKHQFKIYLDPDVRCGHVGKVLIYPDDTDAPEVKTIML